jgi:hypothetical protein
LDDPEVLILDESGTLNREVRFLLEDAPRIVGAMYQGIPVR